jgi:hypothetical protein
LRDQRDVVCIIDSAANPRDVVEVFAIASGYEPSTTPCWRREAQFWRFVGVVKARRERER